MLLQMTTCPNDKGPFVNRGVLALRRTVDRVSFEGLKAINLRLSLVRILSFGTVIGYEFHSPPNSGC
jgi:hypothetical protein